MRDSSDSLGFDLQNHISYGRVGDGKPCNAVAAEEIVGEVGAVEEEDVDEEIWSWNASSSFRRALDCFSA